MSLKRGNSKRHKKSEEKERGRPIIIIIIIRELDAAA